jgi:hypothetical protein
MNVEKRIPRAWSVRWRRIRSQAIPAVAFFAAVLGSGWMWQLSGSSVQGVSEVDGLRVDTLTNAYRWPGRIVAPGELIDTIAADDDQHIVGYAPDQSEIVPKVSMQVHDASPYGALTVDHQHDRARTKAH